MMGPLWVARVGFELLVSIFLGALAGYWLDRKTGSVYFPLFSLVGFLSGSAAGMLLVYRTMQSNDPPPSSDGDLVQPSTEDPGHEGKDCSPEKKKMKNGLR